MLFNSTHATQGPPEGPQFAEAVLDHAGLFIVVVDRQGRIVRFNPACEKLSGLVFASVRGCLLWEIVRKSGSQAFIKETFTRLVREEQPIFHFTDDWVFPNGRHCWITWTITAIPDVDGRTEYLVAVGQDVSAAHELQQQAVENQALTEKIFSEAPMGIGVYRTDGQCVLINETAAHFMHASREQLLQQNFRYLDLWLHSGLLHAADAALAGQPTQIVEIHTNTSFGSEVWLSCRLSCFRLGEQPHLLLLTEDLLERRTAEVRQNLTEARYRTLVEQIPAVTYIAAMDEHTSSIYYSPQVEAMLGYTPEEMVSQPDLWMQMIHPDDRERVYAEISHSKALGHQVPFQVEYRLFRKDGRPVWVKDTARFVDSEPGSQFQQGIMFDITEARQAEENVQREAARQAALNEFSQALAEAGVEMAQVLQRLTVKATELIGDRSILSLVSEDRRYLEPAVVFDLNPVSCQVLQKIFGEDPLPLDIQNIGQIILTSEPLLISDFNQEKDGIPFSADIRATLNQVPAHSLMIVPLRAAGQVIGGLCLTRETPGRPYTPDDLAFLQQLADRAALAVANARLYTRSQRQNQELERRVVERTRDLARSNADLEQFAYIASHDLQEPLRMISSFTQLLERRYQGKLDQNADEFIHFIIDGTRRMQRLINDLLVYSRVGTRGKSFNPVSTEDLLTQVTSNLQIAIEENHAEITHDPLPTVSVDQTQFSQLLQNLIANAIKFHSGEAPRVHISAQHQVNEWVFSVRDNGIGIDAQHYERIFLLFQRLHLHEEYPGTGIGLAVCKKIVERHGGRIWVEATPGQGSIFYFSIADQQPNNETRGRAS